MNSRTDPRHSMVHDLKIDHDYFYDIQQGVKTFEIRKDDRDYQKGDYLLLHAYSQGRGLYENNGSRPKNNVMVKVLEVFGRTDDERAY